MLAASVVLASLVTAGCGRPEPPAEPRVVVVCVEALRHDDPDRGAMPVLNRLAAEGARAQRLVPVFPTNSSPNQAAIATGTRPGVHGIINNIYFDRTVGEEFKGDPDQYEHALRAEPVWTTAVRAGVPAATINWEGGDVSYDGIQPTRISEADEDDGDAGRVDELIEWLDDRGPDVPRLMLVYLEEYDDIGHDYGPASARTVSALEEVDAHLGRIVEAIERNGGAENTTLVVLGDHGMAEVQVCIYVQPYLANLGFDVRSFSSGAASNVYLRHGTDAAEVKAAIEAKDDPITVYLPDEVPAAWGYDVPERVGDLVIVGGPRTYLRDRGQRRVPVGGARKPGMHGFPPEQPDMQPTLVAWGRGVTAGQRWEERSILDLYPTMCELLGLDPIPQATGSVLPGIAAPTGTTAGAR